MMGMSAKAQTIIFHETFNNLTPANTTGNALTGTNVDETGYVVGGGGSGMKCDEAGTMNLTGGRFKTRTMDLSGDNVVLSITYKCVPVSGQDAKRFQVDVDVEGTSGLGGILLETQDASPTTFTTKSFTITGGTASSFLHFRTESSHTIVIDEIKVVGNSVTAAAPVITSFTVEGVDASIDNDNGTITAELPNGTDITALTPTVAVPSGCTYAPTGAVNFTNPVQFTVTNSESAQKTYTVTISVSAAQNSDASLKYLAANGIYAQLADNQTDYALQLNSATTTVELLAVANNEFATVQINNPASVGSTGSVVVTAQNGSTKTYNLTFTKLAAPTKVWNFSDGAAWVAETTVQNLEVGTGITFDANGKTVDTYTFTQRLKFNGTGSITNRYVSFDVTGATTVVIYGMSGSNGTARTLIVNDGTSDIGTFFDAQTNGDATNSNGKINRGIIEYTGSEGTLYLYSQSSGFNIYAIELISSEPTSVTAVNTDKKVQSVEYYDITGRKASATSNGMLIKKTIFTDGTSTSSKIFNIEK
ncbi:hypothetical protein FACS189429_6790 [Bacteroidia bacterium]|nr:hypothetical protein FACS189429_6790 [Bacteroidia bacterium]